MDLHAAQIQGFFDLPVDHLTAVPIMGAYLKEKQLPDQVIVAPDVGGVTRARIMAEILAAPIAIVDKRRPQPNAVEVLNIIGQISGKTAIIIDDMIDTGGSIEQVTHALLKHGAAQVYACCTHPVFSGPAISRMKDAPLKEVIVTNTIPLGPDHTCDKITVLSVAPLLGEAMQRIHMDMSVSELFK
jgi:ribose-phosphate pyrophosphokinase